MTTADLDQLVLRANHAGHNSIAEYAQELVKALTLIADCQSGVWGRIARDVLDGKDYDR